MAGLQAMGTARRLGAVVTGYDIRPETREQIESVGARVLRLASVALAEGEGGYARALTDEEQAAQQAELAAQIARFDVVITTAQVPGRCPPLLVTAEAVKGMQPGSVLVDLAASSLGGNRLIMLKREIVVPPEHLYPPDEWRVVEARYSEEFFERAETVFSLGNGFVGVRGTFEEGRPALSPGTFINGFHETWPIVHAEEAHALAPRARRSSTRQM